MDKEILDRILRLPEVKTVTGLGRSTIYEKMAEKTFPLQIPLGAKSVGWLESDIKNWIAIRISKSKKSMEQIGQQPLL